MNKKDQQKENILQHGFKLAEYFGIDSTQVGPTTLAKSVHRIETRAHRLAEQECNGEIEIDETGERDKRILDALDRILSFRAKGIPVFFNGDPRGHALKVDDKYMASHPGLPTDWGGYGILAPEF